jgi:hypothetical protein
MITLIFSILPFLFIIYYFVVSTKREYITFQLKTGMYCFVCKSELSLLDELLTNNLIYDSQNYTVCKCCDREMKLNQLDKGKSYINLNKFKLQLIKGEKNNLSLIILGIFFVVDMSLRLIFNIYWFCFIYNSVLTLYWILMVWRLNLISVKK